MRYFKHTSKFYPVDGKDIDYIGMDFNTGAITYFFKNGTLKTETNRSWTSESIKQFLRDGYWVEIFPEYPKYYIKSCGRWTHTAYIIDHDGKKCSLVNYDGTMDKINSSFSQLYGYWEKGGAVKRVTKEEAEKLVAKPQPQPTQKPHVLYPIDPSSIEVGMNITVLNHKTRDDRSYRGAVLEVKSVCLPFIVVFRGWAVTLDTRDWDLAQLPQDYVDALKKS